LKGAKAELADWVGDKATADRLWQEIFVEVLQPEKLKVPAAWLQRGVDELRLAAEAPVWGDPGTRVIQLLLSTGVGLANVVQALYVQPSRFDSDIARRWRESAEAMQRAQRHGGKVLAILDSMRQDVMYAVLGVAHAAVPPSRPASSGTGGTAASDAGPARATASASWSWPGPVTGAIIHPARPATSGAAAVPIPATGTRRPGASANLGPGWLSASAQPAPRPPASAPVGASAAPAVVTPASASLTGSLTGSLSASTGGQSGGTEVPAPVVPDAAPAAGRVAQPQASGRRPGPPRPDRWARCAAARGHRPGHPTRFTPGSARWDQGGRRCCRRAAFAAAAEQPRPFAGGARDARGAGRRPG